MADRIRANPGAGPLYDSASTPPVAAACDAATPCDAAQLAAADLESFADAAQRELPGTGATISIHYVPAIGAATTDRYAIVLRWRGARYLETAGLPLSVPPVAG